MMRILTIFTGLLACLLLAAGTFTLSGCTEQGDTAAAREEALPAPRDKLYLDFAGGPAGGTFNYFADKIATIATRSHDYLDLAPKGSGGSADNLRSLHHGSVDLAIVYAADARLGARGLLLGDPTEYDQVRALARLYGAPAQLVVRADSGITGPDQLAGKVVAVGNPGSGAALSAERFFSALDLWERIRFRNLGYSQAAKDFAQGRIDAFWVLAGAPNSAVVEAAAATPVRLLELGPALRATDFYQTHDYYAPAIIPAGTYAGQDADAHTFQDTAMLCAAAAVPSEAVGNILEAVFSPVSLEEIAQAHQAGRSMSVGSGIAGVSIPLHQGALRFWKQQGLAIPASLDQGD